MVRDEIKDKFAYKFLSYEEKAELMTKIRNLFDNFLSSSTLCSEDVDCNDVILCDIATRIDQRTDYYQYFHSKIDGQEIDVRHMSQVKSIALLCYWITKYKPFWIIDKDLSQEYYSRYHADVNDMFAAYIFVSFVYKYYPNEDTKEYYHSNDYKRELVYSFSERDISKESMVLMLASIVQKN